MRFLGIAAERRTWPVVGSLEKARSVGWGKERDIDTFTQGYVPVFEELKRLKVKIRFAVLLVLE